VPRLREVEPLPPLLLDSISKIYRSPMTRRSLPAVRGLSLTLARGEIFGLLGPNGAGKTTTIRMIIGLARPSAGRIRIDGRDPQDHRARRRLGYLPENPCFYDHLSAVEYLGLVGDLFGIEPGAVRRRAELLLERLGLAAHARKPLRKYSKGMTQRLGLAQALLNEPTLLVLDEPMSGLDPIGRAEVKQMLREERERGTTILMSSHVLAETETICDRIGILSEGQLLDVGPVTQLVSSGVREWEVTVEGLPDRSACEIAAEGCRVEPVGARLILRVEGSGTLQRILRRAADAGAVIHSVEPRRRTLEEHFVQVLGRGTGEVR
jgi:ABC-2 type transport system ATP-binding protein